MTTYEIIALYEDGHLQRAKREFRNLDNKTQDEVIKICKRDRIYNAVRFFNDYKNETLFL